MVVGFGTTRSGPRAFRWTRRGGLENLGPLTGVPGGTRALDVSADGSTVVGSAGTGEEGRAFVWTRGRGLRKLESVLGAALGVELDGWTLLEATAVSADGKAVAGTGLNPRGQREAWLARLPD